MTATRWKYRPPFVSQRGIDSTLDDCAVVATIHGLAYATLGEFVTTPQGREMGRAQLQALARRMRRSLGPSERTGGLGNDDQIAMVVAQDFPAPELRDMDWSEFMADARSRRSAISVGGNPADIVGASPLKRCDCAHEWLVAWDPVACETDELLVYDGLRMAGTRARGEVRPAREVRQMSFKDGRELAGVLAFPIGGWTAAALGTARLAARVGALRARVNERDERITDLSDQLAMVKVQRDNARAAAHESAHVASIAWHEEERVAGP